MYTKEIIEKKYQETTNRARGLYVLSHYSTSMIMQNEPEKSSELEYFEALIFSNTFIPQFVKLKKIEIDELLIQLLEGLYEYANDTKDLNWLTEIDFYKFVMKRMMSIKDETTKMVKNEQYMTPILINNLYLSPLNQNESAIDDIMASIDFKDLIKLNVMFKIRFKHFIKYNELTHGNIEI